MQLKKFEEAANLSEALKIMGEAVKHTGVTVGELGAAMVILSDSGSWDAGLKCEHRDMAPRSAYIMDDTILKWTLAMRVKGMDPEAILRECIIRRAPRRLGLGHGWAYGRDRKTMAFVVERCCTLFCRHETTRIVNLRDIMEDPIITRHNVEWYEWRYSRPNRRTKG